MGGNTTTIPLPNYGAQATLADEYTRFLYNTAGMAAVTFATGAYAAWGSTFYQTVRGMTATTAGASDLSRRAEQEARSSGGLEFLLEKGSHLLISWSPVRLRSAPIFEHIADRVRRTWFACRSSTPRC